MAGAGNKDARNAQRFVFSSDHLAELDGRARLRVWRETLEGLFGSFDHAYAEDRPFSVRFEALQFDSTALCEFQGSLVRAGRTARDVAANGSDDFMIGINAGREPALQRHRGREVKLPPSSLALVSLAEAGDVLTAPGTTLRWITVPRRKLAGLVADADDLVARALDPDKPAARHLRRYLDILLAQDGIEEEPLLADRVATTLVDLVALYLGAERDAAEIAAMRGLRAARVQEVLGEIRAGYADPQFSAAQVAGKLGLSTRYVQDLLHETGRSFSKRVLDLRLQKARSMLENPRHDALKVSQIAYACGFNEVSYFNRCFRRRFGISPKECRGGRGI